MCVGIGSFSDPPEAQGLAHFLGLCYKCTYASPKRGLNFWCADVLTHWMLWVQNTCSLWGVQSFQMKMRYVYPSSIFFLPVKLVLICKSLGMHMFLCVLYHKLRFTEISWQWFSSIIYFLMEVTTWKTKNYFYLSFSNIISLSFYVYMWGRTCLFLCWKLTSLCVI